MINFKELPEDGIKFEQLTREILLKMGLEVHWTGVGPDSERDLFFIERAQGPIANFRRKWLVCCKHFAHSERSVGIADIQNITDRCEAIGATGYLLVCSTQPSSTVIKRLEEIESQGKLTLRYWDCIEIEKRLNTPESFPLISLFFPQSAQKNKWKIYNTTSPSFWAANYKDYFFYLCSRTANTFPDLKDVEYFIKKMEAIPLPNKNNQALRMRAVYYDNKHSQYTVFIDCLYEDKNKIMRIDHYLKPNNYNWLDTQTNWDICYRKCFMLSDHFHLDHKDYYTNDIEKFQIGLPRDK